jgi:hypothetical protein
MPYNSNTLGYQPVTTDTNQQKIDPHKRKEKN